MSALFGRNPVLAFLAVAAISGACAPEAAPPVGENFPILEGPYLGQEMPGPEPAVFAPGVVSTGFPERDLAMTPDGSEIYWGVVGGTFAWSTIMVTRRVDGVWTRPEVAGCCTNPEYMDLEPHITPDGRRFMWLSDRPGGASDEIGGQDIWVMDREGDSWGPPYALSEPVNTADSEYFPSTTRDGTLYFTRGPAGGGENLIYRSRFVNGEYQEPELLPEQVNTGAARYNAFVDPDERFLILGVVGREDGLGGTDYYVVFRSEDDRWSDAVNLGPAINTPDTYEYSPYVSPDGRYFFFMTARPDWNALAPAGLLTGPTVRSMMDQPDNGAWDVYWVSADFIEELKPTGF